MGDELRDLSMDEVVEMVKILVAIPIKVTPQFFSAEEVEMLPSYVYSYERKEVYVPKPEGQADGG